MADEPFFIIDPPDHSDKLEDWVKFLAAISSLPDTLEVEDARKHARKMIDGLSRGLTPMQILAAGMEGIEIKPLTAAELADIEREVAATADDPDAD